MKRYDNLLLYTPMIDWFTLTTFNASMAMEWKDKYTNSTDWLNQITIYEGYKGIKRLSGYGTSFVGQNKQAGKDHFLMYLTGAMSDASFSLHPAIHYVERPRVTRIDLQATIMQPMGWNQFDLLNELEKTYGTKVWTKASDTDGVGLRTVYLEWSDDEIVRVYQKLTSGGNILLRFEVQYRNHETSNGKAIRVGSAIWENNAKKAKIWKHAVERVESPMIQQAFSNVVPVKAEWVKAIPTGQRNTRLWLMDTVSKSLDRYVGDNPDDKELIALYLRILTSDRNNND